MLELMGSSKPAGEFGVVSWTAVIANLLLFIFPETVFTRFRNVFILLS